MATETSSERRSRGSCDHLLDLPSSGLLVTFEPDQNEVCVRERERVAGDWQTLTITPSQFKVMVGPSYVCTHDTSPPNGDCPMSREAVLTQNITGQRILSEDRHTMVRRFAGMFVIRCEVY